MPELPEVETIRRGLERRALGRRIAAVAVRNPAVIRRNAARFADSIAGGRITRVSRRGKTLAVELERSGPTNFLVIRLGMTGQLTLVPASAPVKSHTHVIFTLDQGTLRFRDPRRFGRLWQATGSEVAQLFSSLGPDALEIGAEEFERALRGRRGAVKALLLNQRVISGVGNIYADEALYEAGIHPETPAGSISNVRRGRLREALHNVLSRAISLQGTSFRDYVDIEGNPGNFEPRLAVYGRDGERCRRCGARIRRIVVSGRSSHYCPHCQRRPRRARPV